MASSASRSAPNKRVDDSLLKSGVAIMPGGEDQLGRPLVAFPTTTPEMLRQRHTTAHLVLLLRYYVTMSDVVTKNGGLAVIANLMTYSAKDGLQMVVDTLDKLQAEVCGSVGVLYAIIPRSKDAQKTLKKLLGLKPSKKNPKIPTYEAVLLENVSDLQRHIQRRHLTSEFGGTMTYNHRIWAQLTQDMEDLAEAVTSALRRVPDAVDKVTMMSEYDLPASADESEALLLQVRTKYNDVMRDINLEHLIDECKTLQERLSAPHRHEGYNDITQTFVFTEAKTKVVDYRNKLVKARERLKSLWQQAEDRIMLASKVNKYKLKAEKVTEWMQNVGLPTVNQDSDIADCLSKAEILKNHFETGFLSIAKNVLWLADKLLKKFESVLQECGSHTKQHPTGGGMNSQTEPILAYTRQFQATVEYFKRAVEKKHQVYLNVHAFFLSAVTASSDDKETSVSIYRQLQQLTKWYRRTLKFLPVQLLIPSSRLTGARPTTAAPYISSAWRAAVEDYILHQPLPPTDSVTKMKNVIPVIDNINIRNQARLLISRVTMIRSLLVTPELLSPRDLQDVLLWREQVNQGQDEIYLNMTTSTLDLSKLADNGQNNSNPGNLSARHWQPQSNGLVSSETESTSTTDGSVVRTPKLRLSGVNENVYFDDEEFEVSRTRNRAAHGKKHVHLKSPKKERHRDSINEPKSHSNGQHAPSGVPRLDLRGVTNSSTSGRSYTDRGGIIEREQSFGIYGDVTEQKRKPHRRRLGRSVQNLASSSILREESPPQQRTDKELYISLGGTETSGSPELPSSLKHINVSALKKNLPQDQRVTHTPLERNSRPHSYESLVDSGIAHTQSSGDGSGGSVSTNDLSPNLSTGQGRMSAVQEGDEKQGLDVRDSNRSPHPTASMSHSQSIPNLAYERDGRLSLVQNNIDIIVNSPLSAEDKLKLMATMCECESVHSSSQLDAADAKATRLQSTEIRTSSHATDVHNSTRQLETELRDGAVISSIAEIHSEPNALNSSIRSLPADAATGSQPPRARTPKLSGAQFSMSQSLPQQLEVTHYQVDPNTTNVADSEQKQFISASSGRPQGPTEAFLNALHVEGIQGNLQDYSVLGNYVRSAGFGIDIEAWMRNQEDGSEILLPADSDAAEDGMAEYVEKWKLAKENRLTEQEDLLKAREALDDLCVHEEQLKQQAVEQSLSRTQQLLQEQEEILRKEQKKPIEAAAPSEVLPPSSECSLSSGTSTPSPDLHPDSVAFSPDSLQTSDTAHHQAEFSHSSGSGSPPREVYDSSVSGESGVFTLNSTDFRLMKALDTPNSVNSTPRQSSSSSKGQPSQTEVLTARSELLRRSSTSSGTKSGIVKQMDFRDMLRSINAEKEGEDDFEEAVRTGNSLKYAKALDKSIEAKCDILDRVMPENEIQNGDESPPVSGLSQPSDSGFKSVMEIPGEEVINGGVVGGKNNFQSSISGSDVTDDVFGSGDSTPVNTPRGGGLNSLKKWNTFDVSEVQEATHLGVTTIERQDNASEPLVNGAQDIIEVVNMSSTENSLQSKMEECPALESASSMPVSNNTSEAIPHKDQPIIALAKRSEVKGHADMKVKVAAGGGSAWTNAFPIPSHGMEFANLKTPIIIDNGSGMCKCGFADQDLPCAIFPALVGRAKYEDVSMGRMEQHYIGSSAQGMRGVLKLNYPLEHGIITDWNDMELVWQHAFEEQLRVNPAEHPVLVTEAPLNPRKNREQMMELLFETFQVPGVYFAIQAVLALYASGRTTGMVVDSGDGVSHFVPIYEGYSLPHAIKRLNLAGRDLTQYMIKLLYEQGHSFTSTAEQEIVRDLKEQHCFVSKDFSADMKRAETTSGLEEIYTLPDGRTLSLNAERFRCPEVLFDPSLIGREHGGIQDVTCQSAMACEMDLRQELFSNIVLSGGTTMLPGFGDRLQQELTSITPSGLTGSVNVTSPADRYFSVWQGGAVLASLPSFSDSWVSYEEYLDYGSNIIHLKCF